MAKNHPVTVSFGIGRLYSHQSEAIARILNDEDVVVVTPTASGKTSLAVELCQHFPLDIISVDSALVYRGLDIGSARPDRGTLQKAPHRLIDIRDPAQSY